MGTDIQKTVLILSIFLVCIPKTEAQQKKENSFEISSLIGGAIGYEYNPYHSPATFYDLIDSISYSRLDLIKPDFYALYGYELSLGKKLSKKFELDLNSEWKNKEFFNEKILNTHRFNIELAPSITIREGLVLGAGYEFEKRSRVHTDILGEQTRYVLAYIQNSGQLFLKTKLFRKNITNFYYTLDWQKYKSVYSGYRETDTIVDKLNMDNIQHSLEMRFIQYLSSRSRINIIVKVYDRKYKWLPSYDSLLTPNYDIMRHYHDIRGYMAYTAKINNYIEVRPTLEYERKKDLFNDYFSFNRFEGGLELNFFYGKFILNLEGKYNLINYDRCEAPTETRPYPDLKYNLLDARVVLTYKIFNGVDINLTSEYGARRSNADKITWKYRRGYENYYINIGLIMYPDKWFK